MEAIVVLILLVLLSQWLAKGVNYGAPPARSNRAGAAASRPSTFVGPEEYTDERGYQRYTHNHKLVHRDVMERKLGRKLRPEEVVHHKDRNKQNNDPRNLWVFKNQAAHDAQHQRDAEKYGEWWSYNGSGQWR